MAKKKAAKQGSGEAQPAAPKQKNVRVALPLWRRMKKIAGLLDTSVVGYADSILRPVVMEAYREYQRIHNLPDIED